MKLVIVMIKQDQKIIKEKEGKEIASDNLYEFYSAREMILDGFKSKMISIKSKGWGILKADRFKLKLLRPKQMLQRLPIALTQVKAGNNSENLLNEIR